MAKKGPKRKRVTVQLVRREHKGQVTEPYRMMEAIIADARPDLAGVKIGIAWRLGWRADADGYLQLGRCVKRKDLDRELDSFDFILLLNHDAWPGLTESERERWIFHELEHAQVVEDTNGQPKRDDRGRLVCRLRKHDIEEFRSVIERYGWPKQLSGIDEAALADEGRGLLKIAEAKAKKTEDEKQPASDAGPSRSVHQSETHKLRLKGLRNCAATAHVEQGAAGWFGWYSVSMGNHQIESAADEIVASTCVAALILCRDAMVDWLESLTMATKNDQKRRLTMEQKINAEMGVIIDGAKRADDADQNQAA